MAHVIGLPVLLIPLAELELVNHESNDEQDKRNISFSRSRERKVPPPHVSPSSRQGPGTALDYGAVAVSYLRTDSQDNLVVKPLHSSAGPCVHCSRECNRLLVLFD